MIKNTFQILPSVGAGRERGIWGSGILTWDDFTECRSVKGVSEESKNRFDGILEEASGLLDGGDSLALGEIIPRKEHWRMYEHFKDRAAFLDIETDGLERDSTVTVVTVCKGDDVTTLVDGIDLDAESLAEALDDPAMIVSFNGSCFDLPVLRYSFPALDLERPHFDLRFGCRRAGYSGGLKYIERELGMARDDDIADLDGFDAVRLWKYWTRAHDKRSLDLLVGYNRADTINLKTLADIMYDKLVRKCMTRS